jgi:hypothetical protein
LISRGSWLVGKDAPPEVKLPGVRVGTTSGQSDVVADGQTANEFTKYRVGNRFVPPFFLDFVRRVKSSDYYQVHSVRGQRRSH